MDGLINKLDKAEEKIAEKKVNAEEITQHESQRDKKCLRRKLNPEGFGEIKKHK